MGTMIEVQALHKSFTTAKTVVKAVDGVSFEARDGEITGLLGPNGAGKTTTLRMLYTLMKPDSGRVLVDGHNTASEAEAVRRALGVLPDARGVYKRLTARENIAYFGELHGLDEATIATRTDSLVHALNMQDFIDRRTEGFSQGQRTKTAIARALVHDPRNVILDEPTNGLDVMTTRGLREFLKQLRAEGRCVVFSSHIMQEVAALCDRIVIIARGQVVASGTADELRAQTGEENLEDAFVKAIGSEEGLHA
jgi:sodium transport system ATP-binding protein